MSESDAVQRAVEALQAWQVEDVETAARLLESYAGRHELTEADRLEVLARIEQAMELAKQIKVEREDVYGDPGDDVKVESQQAAGQPLGFGWMR